MMPSYICIYLATLLGCLMSQKQVRSGILEPFQRYLMAVLMKMCPSIKINTLFHDRNYKNFRKTVKKEIPKDNLGHVTKMNLT